MPRGLAAQTHPFPETERTHTRELPWRRRWTVCAVAKELAEGLFSAPIVVVVDWVNVISLVGDGERFPRSRKGNPPEEHTSLAVPFPPDAVALSTAGFASICL